MPSPNKIGSPRQERAVAKLTIVSMMKFREDALGFLIDGQFLELADVVDRLEDFERKRQVWDLDIVREGDVYKLTHTGTSLGSIVAEVFFAHLPDRREIVVLGAEQKKAGDPPPHRSERMLNRLNHYLKIAK
jgi:hypothetical protein